MLERLRLATRPAHERLEDALDLLRPPLSRIRFVEVLAGFHVFHRDWEPRIEAVVGDPALLAPRRKLHLIEQDLSALGAPRLSFGAPFALDFITDAASAWGSLYVLEGSTLGGLVISRALRQAGWAPEGGLSYFNPYGPRAGPMWAGFRVAFEAATRDLEADAVVEGAQATFDSLQAGLVARLDVAA